MTLIRYTGYGMSIASTIPLPLPRETALGRGTIDVRIQYGDVPESLDDAVTRTPAFQARPGAFLFFVPGVGRFLVRDGRDVVVQLEEGAGEDVVSLHLSQSVLGALLHQRRQLPLHASAVLVDGGCVAFLGESGAGKSTLAAALRQRGFQTLCDDVCAITCGVNGPVAWPGIRRLKLWSDALESLKLANESLELAYPEGERYYLPEEAPVPDQAYPLRRLYVLREARVQPEELVRSRGLDVIQHLLEHTYRSQYVEALVPGSGYFETYSTIGRSVPLFVWSRPWGLGRLGPLLDHLEHHLKCETG